MCTSTLEKVERIGMISFPCTLDPAGSSNSTNNHTTTELTLQSFPIFSSTVLVTYWTGMNADVVLVSAPVLSIVLHSTGRLQKLFSHYIHTPGERQTE